MRVTLANGKCGNFPLADDVVSNNDLLLVRLGDDSGPVHGDADDGQGAHEGSHRRNGSYKSKKMRKCFLFHIF